MRYWGDRTLLVTMKARMAVAAHRRDEAAEGGSPRLQRQGRRQRHRGRGQVEATKDQGAQDEPAERIPPEVSRRAVAAPASQQRDDPRIEDQDLDGEGRPICLQ